MTEIIHAPPPVWRRTLVLALAAFFLGFLGTGIGLGQMRFLWSAYHHGGF